MRNNPNHLRDNQSPDSGQQHTFLDCLQRQQLMTVTIEKTRSAPLPGTQTGVTQRANQVVKVDDFVRRPGVRLQLSETGYARPSVFMQGHFHQQALGDGLHLRYGDSREEFAYTATAGLATGISLVIFLQGEIEIRVGRYRHLFSNPVADTEQQQLLSIRAGSQQTIQRISRCPQQVRYLSISIAEHWLRSRVAHLGESCEEQRTGLRQEDLRFHAQRLTQPQFLLINEIIRLLRASEPCNPLLLEAKVIELLASTSTTSSAPANLQTTAAPRSDTSSRELQYLRRARNIIQENLDKSLSVGQIARAAGISVSGLQRLFRKREGVSVMEFIRQRRMQRALQSLQSQSLNVQQAAALAGYRNAANFATAFKREFGFTPREAATYSRMDAAESNNHRPAISALPGDRGTVPEK
ncbi:AraC family transcriptional regulator [Microbulbifer sp. ALW1]|uniref:helix-turn-helix transcriptional regulator n=1 Tax=Microbulbifer sp. (strain ALW1) TaxID=1516059 RepID=UPI001357B5F2|nr:AraC family transcriptional regulator [Microbulbifer sp. ALW1]